MKPKKNITAIRNQISLLGWLEGRAGFQDMPAMASPVTIQLDRRGMKSLVVGENPSPNRE